MSSTRGQAVIKIPAKELGLGDYLGFCTGFTGAFVDYNTLGQQARFKCLIQFIQETPDLVKKLKAFIEHSQRQRVLTTEDEIYKEILELFKLMKDYHPCCRTKWF